MAVADVMLVAHGLAGDEAHRMMAEELMLFALRALWNEEAGTFHATFLANSDAAQVLARLASATGTAEYRERAAGILRALAPHCAEHGVLSAPFVSAVHAIC